MSSLLFFRQRAYTFAPAQKEKGPQAPFRQQAANRYLPGMNTKRARVSATQAGFS